MKVKWVCPVCSSTNICEKTEHMQCFVCGKVYEEELHVLERHATEFVDTPVTKPKFKEKIMAIMEKIKSSFKSSETVIPAKRIADWTIEHSPSDSKEAYVEATPVYEEASDRVSDIEESFDAIPEEDSVERIEEREEFPVIEIPMELSEDVVPWEDHFLSFDFEKLRSTGCVDIKKENVHGNKCYKLLYRNGSEKVLTLSNMKIMGYLVERITECSSEIPSSDTRSFIPWPEHRIVFDTEKLNATGCVGIERIMMSGNMCYKLSYRNGAERILNISNLKMMGYARDI